MTLPFQPTDKRQFVCFVCGIAHTDYKEYCTHITSTHEEGRDYVFCPLKRCHCPVRDVVAHFKSRHKSEPLPKTGQLKALIWADQKSVGKRKKKPNFKDGYFTSIKNGSKQMHYRSSYELDVYRCLEAMNEVVNYSVESFRVEYYFNGKTKGYYPDLLIHFNDEHFEVWEIKPTNQTTLPINIAKWDSCRRHCQIRGWKFDIITETRISDLKRYLRGKLILDHKEED